MGARGRAAAVGAATRQSDGHAPRRGLVRPGGCGYGHGFRVYAGARGILYYDDAGHQFLPPVWQVGLRAEARVVNRGKNVGYVECEVTDQDGKQVAKANSTCFVLRGEHARER